MSRKHYQAMADALRCERQYIEATDTRRLSEWSRCVAVVADVFAADNGRFDRERFYRAAGIS
jgi:hypothetical protein